MVLSEIANIRVTNQQLVNSTAKNTVDLVQYLGAIQGQEYALTKWGLGLRLPGSTDSQIEKDLTSGKILRTHLLRPTWHLVAAKDIRWMLQLTAPRVHALNAYMYRQTELDTATFKKCHRIMEKALVGVALTREEINEHFAQQKIVATGHRLSYIMMHAELEGLICSGPRNGNQFTYALVDERVRGGKSFSNEEAVIELAGRYFKSRGPATMGDFATWSGLTMADCKKGVEGLGRKLQSANIENEIYYFFEIPREEKASGLKLLPTYDELIMGYKNRDPLFCAARARGFSPVFQHDCMVLWNGQVIGTWKRTVSGNTVKFESNFFKGLSPQPKNLKKEMEEFKKFFGMKAAVLS